MIDKPLCNQFVTVPCLILASYKYLNVCIIKRLISHIVRLDLASIHTTVIVVKSYLFLNHICICIARNGFISVHYLMRNLTRILMLVQCSNSWFPSLNVRVQTCEIPSLMDSVIPIQLSSSNKFLFFLLILHQVLFEYQVYIFCKCCLWFALIGISLCRW